MYYNVTVLQYNCITTHGAKNIKNIDRSADVLRQVSDNKQKVDGRRGKGWL